jgi:hypothetical protein
MTGKHSDKPTLPAGIYGITAEKYSRGRGNIEVVRAMIAGGIGSSSTGRNARQRVLPRCWRNAGISAG